MKHTYTCDDWCSGRPPESAELVAILKELPEPAKLHRYAPAWGKGSRTAEKAIASRNHNIYARNLCLFEREVLPTIVDHLDDESLKHIALELRLPRLLERSGFVYFTDGTRGSLLAADDLRIADVLDIPGVAAVSAEIAIDHCGHRRARQYESP